MCSNVCIGWILGQSFTNVLDLLSLVFVGCSIFSDDSCITRFVILVLFIAYFVIVGDSLWLLLVLDAGYEVVHVVHHVV